MVADRAGYTVTMFLIDTSPSMGNIRTTEVDTPDGTKEVEMTNLQWSMQFVKLKIQEMIFNGRKTDQCGVIVFGSEETKNIVNAANGGYDNVLEYIPIGQPNATTLAKLDALEPSTVAGDPIDALVVAVETQGKYLATKKSWTRKIYIVTDGESPIELEDWDTIAKKMDDCHVSLTIVGVDFDDEYSSYTESNKNNIKRVNEQFYETLTKSMIQGVVGNLDYALQESAIPEVKSVKSALANTVLRIGDVAHRPDEAIELAVKASKCTALARPKGFKKFGLRVKKPKEDDDMDEDEDAEKDLAFAELKLRTEYYFDRSAAEADENDQDEDVIMKTEDDNEDLLGGTVTDADTKKVNALEKVEKEELVRGYKYGTTYVPCPDGDGEFKRLPTRKGIDICGFFKAKNFRRELCMGEVQYIWADPESPQQQVALSSIVKAMTKKKDEEADKGNGFAKDEELMAIARWVTRDDMAPKMGVLIPVQFDKVDCLLWNQMPFADDVRKYTFASLDKLVNKKGEVLTEHPYMPTPEQLGAMDEFVDAMDLSDAADDEEGNRTGWFAPEASFNPAIHRIKQAMFHCAVVNDISNHPVPPPHSELIKYFEPPKRALKRARKATEQCKAVFNVKEVPKRVAKAKKDEHVHAEDDDDDLLLLDSKRPLESPRSRINVVEAVTASPSGKKKAPPTAPEDSETEDEDEEDLLVSKKPNTPPAGRTQQPLPTPARSISPGADLGMAPGRIVGTTYPLKDFQRNIAQGDVVTKAVEDLSVVIIEIILKPFASRRAREMLECMTTLRKTCLEEDEIEAWNSFIAELKQKCLSKRGNSDFWKEVQELGRDLTLITNQEARARGGKSRITENEAGEFIS